MDKHKPIQKPETAVQKAYGEGHSDGLRGKPVDHYLYADEEVLHRAYSAGHRDGYIAARKGRIR